MSLLDTEHNRKEMFLLLFDELRTPGVFVCSFHPADSIFPSLTRCASAFALADNKNRSASARQQQTFKNICLSAAGCEVSLGLTRDKKSLARDVAAAYIRHVRVFLSEFKDDLPSYVTENFLLCTDIKMLLPRGDDQEACNKVWRDFLTLRREITNRDNPTVLKVVKSQGGNGIPSGGVMNSDSKFWKELVGKLQDAEKRAPNVEVVDEGGSAFKAADKGDVGTEVPDVSGTHEPETTERPRKSPRFSPRSEAAVETPPTSSTKQLFAVSSSSSASSSSTCQKKVRPFPKNLGAILYRGVLAASGAAPPLDYAIKEAGDPGPEKGPNRDALKEMAAQLKRADKKGGGSLPTPDPKAVSFQQFSNSKADEVVETKYFNDMTARTMMRTQLEKKVARLLAECKNPDEYDLNFNHDDAVREYTAAKKELKDFEATPMPERGVRASAREGPAAASTGGSAGTTAGDTGI